MKKITKLKKTGIQKDQAPKPKTKKTLGPESRTHREVAAEVTSYIKENFSTPEEQLSRLEQAETILGEAAALVILVLSEGSRSRDRANHVTELLVRYTTAYPDRLGASALPEGVTAPPADLAPAEAPEAPETGAPAAERASSSYTRAFGGR